MPRTVIDYSKCVIYKIVCKDLNEPYCYVGHTTNFTRRKNEHKRRHKNENVRDYSMKVYQKIRETGGWQNWEMIVIDEFKDCENPNQARAREREWVERLGNLNTNIPCRTNREYYIDNSEVIAEKSKKYQAINSVKISEQRKKFRVANSEKLKELHREYYATNCDKLKEKHKEYYIKNSVKLLERTECSCGSIVVKCSLKRHQKSKKHLTFIQNTTE